MYKMVIVQSVSILNASIPVHMAGVELARM